MALKKNNPLITFVNGLGQILAFFTVALWLVCLINSAVGGVEGGTYFLGDFTGILEYIKYWATLITLALSGLELALKKWWLFVIYAVLVAGCVILMFFPGVRDMLMGITGIA